MAGVHRKIYLASFLNLLPRLGVLGIDAAAAETADIDGVSDYELEIVLLRKGLRLLSAAAYKVRDRHGDIVLGDQPESEACCCNQYRNHKQSCKDVQQDRWSSIFLLV